MNQILLDQVKALLPHLKVPTIFFDLESTGTDPQKDRIVQICAVLVKLLNEADPNANGYKMLQSLINPGVPIPAEATAVHGITNEMVEKELPFANYAKGISDFFQLGECIAGYNILKFDLPLLAAEFDRAGFDTPFTPQSLIWDFMAVYRKMFPNTLQAVYERTFGFPFEGAHDAKTDVMATAALAGILVPACNMETPEALMNFSLDGKKLIDFAGLLTENEAGEICWTFGKHKDRAVNSDQGYKIWFLGNPGFSEATKKIVRALPEK